MKKLLVLPLLGVLHFAHAQISTKELKDKVKLVSDSMKIFCDSVTPILLKANNLDKVITIGSYKSYIDKYFTYLSYNRGVLPSGGSASLELTDNSTQLNLSVARKFEPKDPRGAITLLTGGVKAAVSDGIAQLFSGSSLSSGTTLFGNFAFLPARANAKRRNIASVVAEYDEDGNLLPTPFDKVKSKRARFNADFSDEMTRYTAMYSQLIDEWKTVKMQIANAGSNTSISGLLKRKEEIEKQLSDAGLTDKSSGKIIAALQSSYAEKLYDIEIESDAWLWVKFFWWSGGITYTRLSYDTYNEKAALADRFDSKDFDEVGFTIAANWFNQNLEQTGGLSSTYFNISYQPKTTNNYSILKGKDISQIIYRTPSNTDTVYSLNTSKKAKNITDVDFKKGWQHTFSSTFTGMIGKDQNIGVNARADWKISDILAPVYNTHLGVLLRLSNNKYDATDKNSTAKVNFELFIEFNDMSDVAKTEKSVWQNKVIGINTTVPFNKIFFK